MKLEEMFAKQEWRHLMDGLNQAYVQHNSQLGAKQWQEFYDIAFNKGKQAGIEAALKARPENKNVYTLVGAVGGFKARRQGFNEALQAYEDNIRKLIKEYVC